MPDTPPLVLLLLWLAWFVQSIMSLLQVHRFGRKVKRKIRPTYAAYCPRATVIVPVKGLEDDLPASVRALCTQDYPDYELVAVVESKLDPAHAVLQRELRRYPGRESRILVAGPAGNNIGQKVHNQLAALESIERECGEDEVWVFADTDAVPGPRWLAQLVGPLRQAKTTGLTSGYRWLVPRPTTTGPRGRKASIWSHFASVCNSSVACQLGPYRLNRAWGGSMAIRVATARRGKLVTYLRGALTDDYQFTRMCRDLKLRVAFVSRCLVVSPVDFDRTGFFNFTHRQYLITRVYAPGLYATALAVLSLYVVGGLSAGLYLVLCLAGLAPPDRWWWPAAVMVAVFGVNQVRSSVRARVVEHAFSRDLRWRMRRTLRIDRWLTSVWMLLHWVLVLRAGFGRTMTWRGIRYRLRGPQQIERFERGR